MAASPVAWSEFELWDEVPTPNGSLQMAFRVCAESRAKAEITVRIHFWILLQRVGGVW